MKLENSFSNQKNREIVESIFHPTVHKIIEHEFRVNHNMMIELPPIINNYDLFQKKQLYIYRVYIKIRAKRYLREVQRIHAILRK